MNRTFFFLQNDTKINDINEGVLILESFFWDNVIFNICSFCIKIHVWGREEFLWVAPRDCNVEKLRNKCFLFIIHAGFALQSKSWQSIRGSHTMGNFRYVNCDFWDRRANLENDIASEKRPQNQNAFIKINDLGIILLEKEFYTQ